MKRKNIGIQAAIAGVALCIAATTVAVRSEAGEKAPAATKPAGKAAPKATRPKGVVEPKAVEVLQAMSAKLAAAKSLTFRAVATYESPSVYGPPLAYATSSTVTLQRPDKLKVVTSGDGPAAEFYFDGKTMSAYAPAEKLVATAPAPATIDAMLKAAYDASGTYFPFTDVIVSDPYADIAKNLTLAFYVGQSKVIGGVTTDIVAYESEGVFVQVWIGAEDRLPRAARAVYYDDRLELRHEVEMSDWKLNARVDADDFTLEPDSDVAKVDFAHPKSRQAPAAPKPAAPKAKAASK